MTERKYCRKCGAETVYRRKPTGRFSIYDGKPTYFEYLVCPQWAPRLFGDNGHDWSWFGVRRVDMPSPRGAR